MSRVSMDPEAVYARLKQVSDLADLRPEQRLSSKIDMSPAGVLARLRIASELPSFGKLRFVSVSNLPSFPKLLEVIEGQQASFGKRSRSCRDSDSDSAPQQSPARLSTARLCCYDQLRGPDGWPGPNFSAATARASVCA